MPLHLCPSCLQPDLHMMCNPTLSSASVASAYIKAGLFLRPFTIIPIFFLLSSHDQKTSFCLWSPHVIHLVLNIQIQPLHLLFTKFPDVPSGLPLAVERKPIYLSPKVLSSMVAVKVYDAQGLQCPQFLEVGENQLLCPPNSVLLHIILVIVAFWRFLNK